MKISELIREERLKRNLTLVQLAELLGCTHAVISTWELGKAEKGGYNIKLQCIGPIKPEAESSFNFQYVWYTNIVESAKIASINVQYMDGTIKYITKPKSIMIN